MRPCSGPRHAPGQTEARRRGGGLAYSHPPTSEAAVRGAARELAIATALVPALIVWIDTAMMSGHAVGLADRLSGAVRTRPAGLVARDGGTPPNRNPPRRPPRRPSARSLVDRLELPLPES